MCLFLPPPIGSSPRGNETFLQKPVIDTFFFSFSAKMMNFFYSFWIFLDIAVVFASAFDSSANISTLFFDEGYSPLFGRDNLILVDNGKSVHLSLDQRTGAGFISQDLYMHGFFSASIKLPSEYTAGVVVAFYMSNGEIFEKSHDELDIELLGNVRSREWRVQTNVYGNGSTNIGREERYDLWFDPSDDFHQYAISWSEDIIVFYVDGTPIREMKRTEELGAAFPSKPMSVYATIWDGSDWATNGGKYKVNYKYAPYTARFADLVLAGCSVNPTDLLSLRCDPAPSLAGPGMAGALRRKMAKLRGRYMTYSYCYDRRRYRNPPPECVAGPGEAAHLRQLFPVRFGKSHGGRHGGRRRVHNRKMKMTGLS